MAIVKSGSAKYEGLGKDGKGHVSTQSGALANRPYGFQTRFENEPGTNPEELSPPRMRAVHDGPELCAGEGGSS